MRREVSATGITIRALNVAPAAGGNICPFAFTLGPGVVFLSSASLSPRDTFPVRCNEIAGYRRDKRG